MALGDYRYNDIAFDGNNWILSTSNTISASSVTTSACAPPHITSKYKVGDRVIHKSAEWVGIGIITEINFSYKTPRYSITWSNGQKSMEEEGALKPIHDNCIQILFNGRCFLMDFSESKESIINRMLKI